MNRLMLVLAVTLALGAGPAAAEPVEQTFNAGLDRVWSVTGAVLVVGTFTVLQLTTSFVSFRFRRLRPLLEGEPIVIVQDGKLLERNLKRERLTPEEVAEEARQQQLASLDDVQWAVLEPSGQISFIPKQG